MLVVVGLAVGGCGGGREAGSAPGAPSSFDPAVPALTIELRVPPAAHQGFAVVIEGTVLLGDRPIPASVRLDTGDGADVTEVRADAAGRWQASHVFNRAGDFAVEARAEFAGARAGAPAARVRVYPRKLVYIQGMLSESECPDGRRFATRAPSWLGGYLAAGQLRNGMVLERANALFFSYSGRYCDGGTGANGAAAAYRGEETCGGIERVYAGRLRALIDAAGPSLVTIVAHSMGGVVAAYLTASDPAWAREHIVSVVTFDSPLGGIDLVRTGALSVGSWFTDDCGASSRSVKDLDEDGEIIRLARLAGGFVPFYTLDGTADESRAFGRIEAVPAGSTHMASERLHGRIAQNHANIWGEAGEPGQVDKRRFVACALVLGGEDCLR